MEVKHNLSKCFKSEAVCSGKGSVRDWGIGGLAYWSQLARVCTPGTAVTEQESKKSQKPGSVSKSRDQSQAVDQRSEVKSGGRTQGWSHRSERVPGWSQEARIRLRPEIRGQGKVWNQSRPKSVWWSRQLPGAK